MVILIIGSALSDEVVEDKKEPLDDDIKEGVKALETIHGERDGKPKFIMSRAQNFQLTLITFITTFIILL